MAISFSFRKTISVISVISVGRIKPALFESPNKMKQILFILLLSVGVMTTFAQTSAELTKKEQYKQEVRSKLQLDYSMPDYSTTRISAKVMGPRLAKILETICETYQQYMNLSALSVIQSNQVEGLSYCKIKKMKLDKVTKQGNEIMIRFKTRLESNNLNLKKSQIVFQFNDGASENAAANDFFSNICRYIRE